jgi:hypothetical protein
MLGAGSLCCPQGHSGKKYAFFTRVKSSHHTTASQTQTAEMRDEPHTANPLFQRAATARAKQPTTISSIMLHVVLFLGFSVPIKSFTTTFSPNHRSDLSLQNQQSNSDLLISQSVNQTQWFDPRPHEQRRTQPRKARRLNHPFQHLYRHDCPLFDDAYIAPGSYVMTHSREYLCI